MDKEEVIKRLCALMREVNSKRFDCIHAADCICGCNSLVTPQTFQNDGTVLEYIEDVVRDSLTSR